MSPQLREQRRRHRERRGRIAHPLHERLTADLDGAPEPILEAHAAGERAVKARQEFTAKVREARAAKREAPTKDAEATKQAIAAGKAPPKATTQAAEAKVTEAERHLAAAREHEAESLGRLAVVLADHGAEWEAKRAQALREKSAIAAEHLDRAVKAWQELDREYAIVRWLHVLDPGRPDTLSPAKAPLREDDLDPEGALRRIAGLAQVAIDRAQPGEPGREHRARERSERRQRRLERAA